MKQPNDSVGDIGRVLAEEIRRYRELAGMAQYELADAVFVTRTLITKFESGGRVPTPDTLELIDEALDAKGALMTLRRMLSEGVYPAWVRDLVNIEQRADSISVFEPQYVPGLLQTPDYSRTVLRVVQPRATAEEIEQQAQARMDRQAIFGREHPPQFWAVLDEAVIRRPVGGLEVMAAQLDRLVALPPQAVVQVVPFDRGAHAGMDGVIWQLTFEDGDSIIYTENFEYAMYLDRPHDIAAYSLRLDHLRALALPPEDSRELLAQAAKELRLS